MFTHFLQRPSRIPILAIGPRLCLLHPRADEARVPSSEQGLASVVNLAGPFDDEFSETPLAKGCCEMVLAERARAAQG
jgi:hypothetical protein